jgi:2-polyprenyl-3-methyl-5-hydroxy-6-metoxy-1,4-benzoquinol methylase
MTERQMGRCPEISHLMRYMLAKTYIRKGDKVLDVFCGTGYGSEVMVDIAEVTAFDKFRSKAINKRVNFINAEYPNISFDTQFDLITCFEAIEHIPRVLAKSLLKDIRKWLRNRGELFISSPNKNHFPYDAEKIKHHYFHYDPHEMETDLNSAGFEVKEWFSQREKFVSRIDAGYDGRYMIARCQ